ncbi:MAG: hypothetical protein E7271_09960 [Lachnospiraceae bacterium]|jgi:hypothetical protein|nr:hypothetical protein [Lachnospiraceae bacterium]
MKINRIEDIKNIDINNYCYAWVQEYDSVKLGTVNDVSIDYDNIIEARFFSSDKELHIFCYDDEMCAVEIIKEDEDDYFEEKQILRKRFGKNITLRYYVDYEDDGQAYIVNTVLSDCELN